MKLDDEWGTDLEIKAAAQLYNINIDIFRYKLSEPERYKARILEDEVDFDQCRSHSVSPTLLDMNIHGKISRNSGTLALAFINGNHYQPIVKASEKEKKNYSLQDKEE